MNKLSLYIIFFVLLLLALPCCVMGQEEKEDSLKKERKFIVAIGLNIFTKPNYQANIGEMSLYYKSLLFPSIDFALQTKKGNYHTLGLHYLKPNKHSSSDFEYRYKGYDVLESMESSHFFIQLKYCYSWLFLKQKKWPVKPYIAGGFLPFYQKGRRYVFTNFDSWEESERMKSKGIVMVVNLGVAYCSKHIFINLSTNLNIAAVFNEEYEWNNAYISEDPDWGYSVATYYDGSVSETYFLWPDYFISSKYLFESIGLKIGYKF